MIRIKHIPELAPGATTLPEGAFEILATPSAGVRAALRRTPRAERPAVSALVPDMQAWVRDASDLGLARAAVLRAKRSGPVGVVRAARTGAASFLKILRGDAAAALPVLLELELAALGRTKPVRIVLAAGITDLGAATGDRRMIASFIRYARRRSAEAWLETRNLGHLLGRLRAWQLEVDGILTPLNPRGYGMKPRVRACVDEIGRTRVRIWARDVTAAGTVTEAEGYGFAAALGTAAVVVPAAGYTASRAAEPNGESR